MNSKISRRELLHQKISNLVNWLSSEFPDRKLYILEIQTYSDPEIYNWILTNIIPYASNLPNLVDRLCSTEQIHPSKDVRQKLIRYCQFFCEILKPDS